MKRAILVTAVLLSTLASKAQSGRWVTLYRDDKQVWAFDSTRSVKKDDGYLMLWLRTQFAEEQEFKDYPPYDTAISKIEVDCSALRTRILAATYYRREKVVYSGNVKDSEWQEMVPDTAGEAVFTKACGYFSSK